MREDLYFTKDFVKNELSLKIQKKRSTIIARQNRKSFLNVIGGALQIFAGDIISIYFLKKYDIYQFEGIILSIKGGLVNSNVTIRLRNILLGVGMEYTVSYYYNRLFQLQIKDYKRKRFLYRRSKLYYIRAKKNRASRVK
jgi:ribosomal protein L19